MTSEDYVIWLEKFLSLNQGNTLTKIEVKLIKEKLDSVFNKVTPEIPNYPSIYPTKTFEPFVEPTVITTCGLHLDCSNVPINNKYCSIDNSYSPKSPVYSSGIKNPITYQIPTC